MNKLKSCPFCGREAVLSTSSRYPRSGENEGERVCGYTVICSNYNCVIYRADNFYQLSQDEAIKAWNSRIPLEVTDDS